MPRKTPDKYYEENKEMMFDRAWKWTRSSGREFSDIIGVCHVAFMECVRVFDKKRGARFSSLLGTMCNQHIIKYVCKFDEAQGFVENDQRLYMGTIEEMMWNDLKEEIEKEVGTIIKVIIDSFEEIIEGAESLSTRSLRKSTKKVLAQKGFDQKEIDGSFKAIKHILSEVRL